MKFFIYLLITTQLFSIFSLYAERKKKDSPSPKSVFWEKVKNDGELNNGFIIWKSYKNNQDYFLKKDLDTSSQIKDSENDEHNKSVNKEKSKNYFLEIDPHLPLNNFLEYGNFQTSVRWKSSFDGGLSGGTGQQNPSFIFDYGISNSSLLSFYITGADDDLYNLVGGQKINYYWQNYALSVKKKLIDEDDSFLGLSFVSTLEYWRHASGSKFAKSIYNQQDSLYGKDKFENLIGAISLPLSKNINKNFSALIVPGVTFLPEKLGSKGIGKNAYGNNFYIGSGIVFDVAENLNLLFSYTIPLGPGNNYFDSDLNFSRKSIYSFGLGWDVNPKISIAGKITNSYGASPSTALLTIPSDNLPLYSAYITYKPYGEDTYLANLDEKDKSIGNGGITVNNALMPRSGTSQINFNYDNVGNLFGSYSYSLSNIFQLELLNVGSFNGLNSSRNKNSNLYSTYLSKDNLNFRLGGKLLIFSPQKNDLYWAALRSSVGRNEDTNQGYLFTEFINTFRLNNWLTFNISPKYFFSGVESFGGIGISSYINLSNNLLLIPEINTTIKNDSDLNSTLAIRYSFSPEKSLDLYYSNAAGVQDIGQLLKDEQYRLGIKINFLY